MSITYVTRITDGIIYGRTVRPNGGLTEEHIIPASVVFEVTLVIESLKGIRGDVNKKIAGLLKSAGLSVIDIQVLAQLRASGRDVISRRRF